MIQVAAILNGNLVIIHNDSTVSTFEQRYDYTPLRGYYDDMFNHGLFRRTQIRASESISRMQSKHYPFDSVAGITINPNGELHTHVMTYLELDDGSSLAEQVAEFQGLVGTMGDCWFGGDNYSINALSLLWEQEHKLTPENVFPILDPARATSSVELIVATISIPALLQSLEMFKAGMYQDILKMWKIEKFERPIHIKEFNINDVQEFNSTNLGQITTYYTVPTPKEV